MNSRMRSGGGRFEPVRPAERPRQAAADRCMKRRAREQRLCRAFGRYVRTLRKQQKLTQEGLALLAGLSADTIRRVETGVWPRFETLNRLSRGLGMSTSSLLEGFETGRRDEARELVAL